MTNACRLITAASFLYAHELTSEVKQSTSAATYLQSQRNRSRQRLYRDFRRGKRLPRSADRRWCLLRMTVQRSNRFTASLSVSWHWHGNTASNTTLLPSTSLPPSLSPYNLLLTPHPSFRLIPSSSLSLLPRRRVPYSRVWSPPPLSARPSLFFCGDPPPS